MALCDVLIISFNCVFLFQIQLDRWTEFAETVHGLLRGSKAPSVRLLVNMGMEGNEDGEHTDTLIIWCRWPSKHWLLCSYLQIALSWGVLGASCVFYPVNLVRIILGYVGVVGKPFVCKSLAFIAAPQSFYLSNKTINCRLPFVQSALVICWTSWSPTLFVGRAVKGCYRSIKVWCKQNRHLRSRKGLILKTFL